MAYWCLWGELIVVWLHNQWGDVYVGRAVNNKLLVALSAIGAQQTAATEDTAEAIEQLLDMWQHIQVLEYYSGKAI